MKLAIALCFLASTAAAQVVGDGMGSPYGGTKANVTYTGPGDVVSGASAWYGLRAYNAAYATAKGKAVNLRRASDNATCDFDVATTGAFGVSDSGCGTGVGLSLAAFATQDATCTGTIASTTLTCASASSTPHAGSTLTGTGLTQPSYIVSCGTFTAGAGTCTLNAAQTVSVGETITMTYGLYVTEAYDQSGHNGCSSAPCNPAQATAGNQPQLLPICVNSLPCIQFTGSSIQYLQLLNGSFSSITNQPYSISLVSIRTGSFTSFGVMFDIGNNAELEQNSSANTWSLFAGTRLPATASDSAWHAAQGVFNGASPNSIITIDATDTTGSSGSNATTTGLAIGAQYSLAFPLTGRMVESGIWPVAFTSGNRTNLCHNQYTYWGTSTSC